MSPAYRYWVRSPDGRAIYGFDKPEVAESVALQYGAGAALVDTLAQAYQPMLQVVAASGGAPGLVYGPVGGWDTGRFGLERDLIEAVKKGEAAIVHAFLAKGASPNARDAQGGSALHWAAGRGKADVVTLLLASGAEAAATDAAGRTPRAVAERRGHSEIAALLGGPATN